jgi:hypothetical protein
MPEVRASSLLLLEVVLDFNAPVSFPSTSSCALATVENPKRRRGRINLFIV